MALSVENYGVLWRLLHVLHLLAHLIDGGLEVKADPGQLGRLRL